MLFGVYNHQLDAKARLRLPAKLKPELGSDVLITKGVEGCLFVFSQEKIIDIQARIKNVPLGNNQAQDAVRKLFSSAFQVEEDSQGRFVLPTALRSYAKIDKDIVIIGVGDRAEIWAQEEWEKISNDNAFDTALSELGKYGV